MSETRANIVCGKVICLMMKIMKMMPSLKKENGRKYTWSRKDKADFLKNGRARTPRQRAPRKDRKFIQAESLLKEIREKPANERLPEG